MKFNLRKIIFTITILLCMEIFGFNFRYWESISYQEKQIDNLKYGNGIEKQGDIYKITNPENAFFEMDSINVHLSNIYANITGVDNGVCESRFVPIRIYMTDAANAVYRELPQINIVRRVKESQYIRLHLSGETKKIKIKVELPENAEIKIEGLSFNKHRPFMFHPLRIVCLGIIVFLFEMFRPKSRLYSIKLNFRESWQRRAVLLLLAFNLLIMGGISVATFPNRNLRNGGWPPDIEYEELTDALLDGHVYLNMEPADSLKKMDNPYDPQLRGQVFEKTDEIFYVDHAYYNGKYYCYFGVVPALVFFVPFKALFGVHLPIWIAVSFCGFVYCVVSYIFIYLLIKKYFPNTSIGLYLLTSSVFIAMSTLVYLMLYGTVYSMPIIMSLMLGIIGLSFWLAASGAKRLNKVYLVLGAISIALIIGCRPQLAIVLLFAFPIFWNDIKEKKFFSLQGMGNTVCVIAPFVIIGCALLWYNYIRFGNVMDFGANYNLTSNDMTHRGIDLDRNWVGVFEYLFQPLSVSSKFPFLQLIGSNVQFDYQGYLSQEPLFGGFIWFNPIILLCYKFINDRKKLKEKEYFGLGIAAMASGLIIILLTIQMSGMTQRYMSDFGWFFAISTSIIVLFLSEEYANSKIKNEIFMKCVVGLSITTIFLNYFNVFISDRYQNLLYTNPNAWFWLKYVFFSI